MNLNSKFSLALIALVGVGVFALPSTMALFAGQHSFYNIDATGNQIPCTKCHGDVKAELSSGSSAVTGTKGPHAAFKCEYCHRAENGFASGDDAYAKITYSNATGGRIYPNPCSTGSRHGGSAGRAEQDRCVSRSDCGTTKPVEASRRVV